MRGCRTWRLAILLLLAGATAATAQDAKKPPYWAALTAGDALMRSGPGRDYPAVWRYRRSGLPLRVIAIHEAWRKVQDPDGATGWMNAVLLTDARWAMVTGGEQALRDTPDPGARTAWKAQAGVVGRLSKCDGGWCRLDVNGRAGFLRQDALWGTDAGEAVE